MAEQPEQPAKRWVLISMLHSAVERTEEQIAELKTARLFVRDASGPEDHHDVPKPAVAEPVLVPETVPRPAAQSAAPKPAA